MNPQLRIVDKLPFLNTNCHSMAFSIAKTFDKTINNTARCSRSCHSFVGWFIHWWLPVPAAEWNRPSINRGLTSHRIRWSDEGDGPQDPETRSWMIFDNLTSGLMYSVKCAADVEAGRIQFRKAFKMIVLWNCLFV